MSSQITFNLEQGAMQFIFSRQAALELQAALVRNYAVTEATGRPGRQNPRPKPRLNLWSISTPETYF